MPYTQLHASKATSPVSPLSQQPHADMTAMHNVSEKTFSLSCQHVSGHNTPHVTAWRPSSCAFSQMQDWLYTCLTGHALPHVVTDADAASVSSDLMLLLSDLI